MKARKLAAVAAAVTMTAGLAACGGSDDDSGSDQTLTFWHNSTTGEGKAYWAQVAADFETANPGTTITVQAIQNEEMDGKLQTALGSGDGPDVFLARGGGKLADVVAAGQVLDITSSISSETRSAVAEGTFSALSVDGKIYGMPTSVLPGGIYYSKDLFEQAGITSTPTTIDDLDAAVTKLKSAGIQPIAVGAKDAWPAAHWYYFFALRECSQDALSQAAESRTFDDQCWTKAGEDLQALVDTKPFNQGFLTTSAQQGAGSSAGLLANHKAAMELMGAWDPGVISSLTSDQKPLSDLGWFPFPSISGGQGDPAAMMGGVDGFSCAATAPEKLCTDFLNFFMQKKYQVGYANAFQTIPASQEAQVAVTDAALKDNLAAINNAPYVSVWLDTLYGQNVGNALNTGVVNLFADKGDAADIVSDVNDAAARG